MTLLWFSSCRLKMAVLLRIAIAVPRGQLWIQLLACRARDEHAKATYGSQRQDLDLYVCLNEQDGIRVIQYVLFVELRFLL
jgi:hypothetical protein